MVNIRAPSTTLEGTSNNGDVDAMTEMHATMDELRHHNQTLEDDVHNIRQRQQKPNPPKEMELLDPQSLSNDIWGAYSWGI